MSPPVKPTSLKATRAGSVTTPATRGPTVVRVPWPETGAVVLVVDGLEEESDVTGAAAVSEGAVVVVVGATAGAKASEGTPSSAAVVGVGWGDVVVVVLAVVVVGPDGRRAVDGVVATAGVAVLGWLRGVWLSGDPKGS